MAEPYRDTFEVYRTKLAENGFSLSDASMIRNREGTLAGRLKIEIKDEKNIYTVQTDNPELIITAAHYQWNIERPVKTVHQDGESMERAA